MTSSFLALREYRESNSPCQADSKLPHNLEIMLRGHVPIIPEHVPSAHWRFFGAPCPRSVARLRKMGTAPYFLWKIGRCPHFPLSEARRRRVEKCPACGGSMISKALVLNPRRFPLRFTSIGSAAACRLPGHVLFLFQRLDFGASCQDLFRFFIMRIIDHFPFQ